MRLSRRTFAKAGVAAVGTLAIGGVRAGPSPALLIYDSRIARSSAFAAQFAAARLDLATQEALRWRTLREPLPAGKIVGLTRWSDYVIVRSLAGDQRLRLRREIRRGSLFEWELG